MLIENIENYKSEETDLIEEILFSSAVLQLRNETPNAIEPQALATIASYSRYTGRILMSRYGKPGPSNTSLTALIILPRSHPLKPVWSLQLTMGFSLFR